MTPQRFAPIHGAVEVVLEEYAGIVVEVRPVAVSIETRSHDGETLSITFDSMADLRWWVRKLQDRFEDAEHKLRQAATEASTPRLWANGTPY